MINGTKAIEYIYTATRKNAGRDACIGAAFSSLYEAGGTIKSAV